MVIKRSKRIGITLFSTLFLILTSLILVFFVSAQSSQGYPQMFITNDELDVTVIVPKQGSSDEILAGTNIATKLIAYFNDLNSGIIDSASGPEEARFTIGNGRDRLELEEELSKVSQVQTINANDFPQLLTESTITTREGTTLYTEHLNFESSKGKVSFDETYDDEIKDVLIFPENQPIFSYELIFAEGLRSRLDAFDHAEDIESEIIQILGIPHSISQVRIDNNAIDFELVSQDIGAFSIAEGESVEGMFNGENIFIEATSISDTTQEVVFTIEYGGQTRVTDQLLEGDTYVDNDIAIHVEGTIINEIGEGESDESSSGKDIVTFSAGTQHLVFSDEDFTDTSPSSGIYINGERISSGNVAIQAAVENNKITINSLKYRIDAESDRGGDIYIEKDKGLRSEIEDEYGLISPYLDIIFNGLEEVETHEVKIEPHSDERYYLIFKNNEGTEYEIPIADNTLGNFKVGDERSKTHYKECLEDEYCINQSDSFFVSTGNSDDSDTYVLEYDTIDTNNKIVSFEELGTGQNLDIVYTGAEGVGAQGEIPLEGYTILFKVGPGDGDNQIAVDIDNNDIIDDGHVSVVTQDGFFFTFTEESMSSVNITASVHRSSFDEDGIRDSGEDEKMNIFITAEPEGKIDLTITPIDNSFALIRKDSDLDIGMSLYGTLIELTEEETDPAEIVFSFPKQQRTATIDIVWGQEEASVGSQIDLSLFSSNPTQTDDEIFNIEQNSIVVGTLCANTVAKQLFDSTFTLPDGQCEALPASSGFIIFLNKNNNNQILVTGKTGAEVELAANTMQAQNMFGREISAYPTILKITGANVEELSQNDFESLLVLETVSPPQEIPTNPPPTPDIIPPIDPFENDQNSADDFDDTLQEDILENNEITEEKSSLTWLWFVLGLLLIGGSVAGVYYVLKQNKLKTTNGMQEERSPPAPEGYTKDQWKQALEYYKQNYPEWYKQYMEWWENQKQAKKDTTQFKKQKQMPQAALISLLIGASIVGLLMVIGISLPNQTQVGLASSTANDLSGHAFSVSGTQPIICENQEDYAQAILSSSLSHENMREALCRYSEEKEWQCIRQGKEIKVNC